MHRISRQVLLVAAVSLLAACAGRVDNVWIDPSVKGGSLGLRKVATIGLFKDGGTRRIAEDELASAIEKGAQENQTGVEAVASYTVLSASDMQDAESLRSALAAAGFDGAVVVSVVSKEQRVTATPSTTYSRWGGPGWGVMYDTSTVRTDTILHVQTNIYSVDEAKLLWSGTSRSIDPRDVSRLIGDVVRDVGHALRKEGLVP